MLVSAILSNKLSVKGHFALKTWRRAHCKVVGCQVNTVCISNESVTVKTMLWDSYPTLLHSYCVQEVTHNSLVACDRWRQYHWKQSLSCTQCLCGYYICPVYCGLYTDPLSCSPVCAYVTQTLWIQFVQSLSYSALYSAFTGSEEPWATS